mmetsp:Transcript_54733/g.177068  ORF Transcript_54733/g.177068 Transcript_54733/m.177068 type:complete len:187 (-) Transcript_54733:21-581(-)
MASASTLTCIPGMAAARMPAIVRYADLTDEEKLQADMMVWYLGKQGIVASKEDVHRIGRDRQFVSTLVGAGRDLAAFITDPNTDMELPLTLKKVDVEPEKGTVTMTRFIKNGSVQIYKLDAEYGFMIKANRTPWAYVTAAHAKSGLLGQRFASSDDGAPLALAHALRVCRGYAVELLQQLEKESSL